MNRFNPIMILVLALGFWRVIHGVYVKVSASMAVMVVGKVCLGLL